MESRKIVNEEYLKVLSILSTLVFILAFLSKGPLYTLLSHCIGIISVLICGFSCTHSASISIFSSGSAVKPFVCFSSGAQTVFSLDFGASSFLSSSCSVVFFSPCFAVLLCIS
ncbi:hypothetical protein NERG_02736 [Nematocida ausubeli]|uniref:Uncharacterized protein n=1 Tax=Nematocida ausubeli (strain ATCC PRA-371 / ERTm2) TaxID=1913371 RepID=H8ZGL5_NEMA1|nr:hypothetical protein NERG_02736 [Nematocida ausubeli]